MNTKQETKVAESPGIDCRAHATAQTETQPKGQHDVNDAPLKDVFAKNVAAAQLLHALSVDSRCLGLQKIVNTFLKLSKQTEATERLLPRELAWSNQFVDLKKKIDDILKSENQQKYRVDLSSPVADDQLPGFCRTLSSISWISDAHDKTGMDRLVVAVVITATANNVVISEVLSNGIRQCYRAIVNQTRKHWFAIAKTAPATTADVNELLTTSKPGVTTAFLEELNKLFSLEIPPPPTTDTPDSEGQLVIDCLRSSETKKQKRGSRAKSFISDTGDTDPEGTNSALQIVAPSIRSMVRASQLCTLSKKLGVPYQWDFLSPKNLALQTKKLATLVDHENDKISSLATLALASLQIRTNAKAALLTPTEFADPQTRGDLWISVTSRRLMWNHVAYMRETNPEFFQAEHNINLENAILLSPSLHRGLTRHMRWSGEQPTIGRILSHPFGEEQINLTEFNSFLRGIGDSAHIAEPTRFAHSLGPAILEVTGSDMLSALAGLDFEVAAPAALYYFSPRQIWVDEMCRNVYTHLGL